MLRLVKAVMDQRAAERSYGIAEVDLIPTLGWSLPALRRVWNARKAAVAPWWCENSKEAYNTGLESLARSLEAWSRSRLGRQAGPVVGFPRFHSRRDRASVRFTTGAIRVGSDRHHVTLPRLGTIRVHESTRKLARRVEAGSARVLSATVTCDGTGRWCVAFQVLVQRTVTRPAHIGVAHPVVGVDVGLKNLLVVAAPDGVEVERVPAPKSLKAAQAKLRVLQRKAARQNGPYDPATKRRRRPSNRWRRIQTRIAKTHARAADLRRDALHKATTRLAQRHEVVVVETLNASGMRARGGVRKRGLNRALADAALAQVRRLLTYKTSWYGSTLVEADRWYPSSKTCSGCGSRKPRLQLSERKYGCENCGLVLDRDLNAAINLARLGVTQNLGGTRTGTGSSPAAHQPSDGRVGQGHGAVQETEPTPVGDAAGDEVSTRHDKNGVGQAGTASSKGEAASWSTMSLTDIADLKATVGA
jgi:putative transposase